MSIQAAQIKQFAKYADNKKNGGNDNKVVDGNEIVIFKNKVKTVDSNIDVDKILEAYNNNKVEMELDFELNGTKSNSTAENAIISVFNADSALNSNSKIEKKASVISDGIKASDGKRVWWNPFSWFNDEDEMLTFTDMIDETNVLKSVEDDTVIEKIADADDEVRKSAGIKIIKALVKTAEAMGINVSNIVMASADENGAEVYVTGRDMSDIADFGSDATDDDTIEAVITMLRDTIISARETACGKNDDSKGMLQMLAKRIDADRKFSGNGNGYLDTTEEIKQFKQVAASRGYDINTVLEEIRDNKANGVENNDMQELVYNIFDPEQKASHEAQAANDTADISAALDAGINGNTVLLDRAISLINSDNVTEILENNPNLINKLTKEFGGGWFTSDTSSNYTAPILNALYEYAQKNGIDTDDIVLISGGKFITGNAISGVKIGSDALDPDIISKVVDELLARIEQEQV